MTTELSKKVTDTKQMLPVRPVKRDLERTFPQLPEYLTAEEAHAILSVIDKERNLLLFRLLWQTGLRISEALSFTIGAVKDGIYFARRKGGYIKPVNIPQDLLNALYSYSIKQQLAYDTPLFPITRQQAWRLLQRYAKLARLNRKIHPHLFRHGFAVNVLKQIPNLPVIQDQLGHESIETTRRYIRIIMPDVKQVLDNIQY